jgi:hypothetical protein
MAVAACNDLCSLIAKTVPLIVYQLVCKNALLPAVREPEALNWRSS